MTEEKDRIIEAKEYRQQLMDKLSLETASVETCKTEENKELYAEKMEKRLEKLKSMMDDMTEKSKHMEKNLKDQFEKENELLEKRYQIARSKLDAVGNSGEQAFEELRKSSLKAWQDLTDGIKNAAAKFQ